MRLYLYEDHDSLSVVNMPSGRKFKKAKLSEIKLRIRIFHKTHKNITREKNGFELFYIAKEQNYETK